VSVPITGAAVVAGVVGAPISHSLSPVLHNAWIAEAGLDAAYVPFAPHPEAFESFVAGLRGGSIRGLNVTIPFKERALAAADRASSRARLAGAANVLLFQDDGVIFADNTDGEGMMAAFKVAGFDPTPKPEGGGGPVVIFGAGGAAHGAASCLVSLGVSQVRIVNRTLERAQHLADQLGPTVVAMSRADEAFAGAAAIVNATSLGLGGGPGPEAPFELAPPEAVVMDMVYKPLRTEFLREAAARGHRTVDGLAMLIGQAVPSFEAFYGRPPPAGVDVRALALAAIGAKG
jgi:shikimate dehydrogenase